MDRKGGLCPAESELRDMGHPTIFIGLPCNKIVLSEQACLRQVEVDEPAEKPGLFIRRG
jgi:hypothetical protein